MSEPKAKSAENTTETAVDAPAAAPEVSPVQVDAPQVQNTGRVVELEAEVASLKDQLLRALAEAENIRRRAAREREDTAKYAVTGFAKEMIVVADNLRRALEAVPVEAVEGNEPVKNMMVGVEATERQLLSAFDRAGIRKVEPLDQPFDPNFHRVMFEVENTGKPAGTIVNVLQPGYVIHDRLLREAMVGVAKAENGQAGKVDTVA